MKYIDMKYCRCCGSFNMEKYLDLGRQPLANSYHKIDEELDTYPLSVNYCRICFNSQLSVVIEPKEMFEEYLYVSGTTKTLSDHFDGLVEDIESKFTKERLDVLEIACNDGTLMRKFKDKGHTVTGVDPAKNLAKYTEDLNVIVDFWTKEISKKLVAYDVIVGCNVFAHVNEALEFLVIAEKNLKPYGFIVLEFPYFIDLFEKNEFDTVYHEHLSYFTVSALAYLAMRADLTICDITKVDIHGGSLRVVLTRPMGGITDVTPSWFLYEECLHMYEEETYAKLQPQVDSVKEKLLDTLAGYETVVGYGASAKGNTMMNYFNPNLRYIVDDNPLKHGYLTPGKNFEIHDPEILSTETGDLAVVILSWNFYDEIREKIEKLRPNNNTFLISYVPDVMVEKV
jgi:2-polyprenyl-3-methyl-5-hydroxy-6-metoxy-1,4-benzoquinol methylase